MAAHDITAPALGNPVLFVVDADPQARAVTESALARRFGPDYRVLAADAPRGGLEALERLAAGGGDVAPRTVARAGLDELRHHLRAHLDRERAAVDETAAALDVALRGAALDAVRSGGREKQPMRRRMACKVR